MLNNAMDDLTLLQGAATIVVLSLGTFLTLKLFQRNKTTTIPHVHSWLPFIGSGIDYFRSVVQFAYKNREKHGNAFFATIFGREWLFVFQKEDISKVVRSSEKDVSMYQGVRLLAGKLFPNDTIEGFKVPELERLASRRKISATPLFIHSLKPQRLRAWIPSIREMLQEDLGTLPASGKVDLFAWCNDLVSAITARVLLGDIAKDKELSARWIQLVRETEPISAVSDAFSSASSFIRFFLETTFNGERSAYAKARELLYPFIDSEIEKCIAGEPEGEGASVLSSLVRSWYKQSYIQKNPEHLRGLRLRIANDSFLFTFAAVSNSYAAAAWALWHILRNTAGAGDRTLAELDQYGADSDCLPEMEKLIYEIGRLYTPGTLFRLLVNDFKLPSTGDVIPAGSFVACNAAVTHRNADAYSKPLEFDPSRFDEGRDEQSGAAGLFFPFGAGAHPCAGRRFALMEIALFVTEALQQFEWTLVDEDERTEDPFTQSMVTNVPRHPKLNSAQNNSIWRPVEPVWAYYERKTRDR